MQIKPQIQLHLQIPDTATDTDTATDPVADTATDKLQRQISVRFASTLYFEIFGKHTLFK